MSLSVAVDWGNRDARSARTEEDYCSKEGAEELGRRIVEFWAARGKQVTVALVERGFHPTIRHSRFEIRSTLKNGLPSNNSLDAFANQYIQET